MGSQFVQPKLFVPDLLHEALWSSIAPGCRNCFLQRFLSHHLQMDAGGTAPSPGSLHWDECVGIILREIVLLLRRELDHAPTLGWIAQSGEYLSVHAKIGMVHVRTFGCFRKGKSETAKIIGSQGVSSPIQFSDDVSYQHNG